MFMKNFQSYFVEKNVLNYKAATVFHKYFWLHYLYELKFKKKTLDDCGDLWAPI